MRNTINISLVGVGGQGILLASEILCQVGLLSGKDVKKSEVHGMAQRGGSVISQVRMGNQVHSPLIPTGESDILVSFEKLEALRYAHLLAPEGTALVNNQEIKPITVSSGQAEWPDDLDKRLCRAVRSLVVIPALEIAQELGDTRVVNLVMLGAVSLFLDQHKGIWLEAITNLVKPQFLDVNLKAFDAGRACVEQSVA